MVLRSRRIILDSDTKKRLEIEQLVKRLGQPGRLVLGGPRGASAAWHIAVLYKAGFRPSLVVVPDQMAAEQLRTDILRFLGLEPDQDAPFSPSTRQFELLDVWEARPEDDRSPPVLVSSRRVAALYQLLARNRESVVIAPAESLLLRPFPPQVLRSEYDLLAPGEAYDFQVLSDRFSDLGYRRMSRVEDRGEFAVKGSIIDIYPAGHEGPLRLDFDTDTLRSIRPFDPENQRTIHIQGADSGLSEFVVLPASEMLLKSPYRDSAVQFLNQERDRDEVDYSGVTRIRDDVANGIHVSGLEFLLPAFYGPLPAIDAYVKGHVVVVDPIACDRSLEDAAVRLKESYTRRLEEKLPLARYPERFSEPDEIKAFLDRQTRLEISGLEVHEKFEAREHLNARITDPSRELHPAGTGDAEMVSPIEPVVRRLSEWKAEGYRILIVAHTRSGVERIRVLLEPHGLAPITVSTALVWDIVKPLSADSLHNPVAEPLRIVQAGISNGFVFPDERLAVITEADFFNTHQHKPVRAPRRSLDTFLTSIQELKAGDYVVHSDYGIGRYLGIKTVMVDQIPYDVMEIEYHGNDKLLVPVDRFHLVARYSSAEGQEPVLDRLGGTQWQTTCKKAREAVYKLAAELLGLYAQRQVHPAYPGSPPQEDYRKFEAEFEYDETPDQEQAIEEILNDLASGKPMDRLVCGDVGYGKTEVALRAAYKAVLDGKQVAVLVPTTILAQQHYETFAKRLQHHGVRLEMVSRFRSAAEQREILRQAAAGQVDIVIGTHRLLQNDVSFKDLGLVIIDEEHRFGVKHKERLKKLRVVAHSLTLSATPIPRTLQMSLAGIRDFSLIATPPQDRLSVRTVVSRYSDRTIKEAIEAEVHRGGQIYYIFNRVQGIEERARTLRELLPDVRIEVAHGQMDPSRLEKVMLGFLHNTFHVLLCTTIVESGLDIPNANTMIIERADRFGLAQMYQLRGRVGRSSRRGYCYLLLPPGERLHPEAEKRLRVLQEYSDLGSGFKIASFDLELRGGGNVLGDAQSGHIAAVGMDHYLELLDRAVHELKGQPYREEIEPEVKVPVATLFPATYIPDLTEKLVYYKKLSAVRSPEELESARDELIDCFGPLPAETENLIHLIGLKIRLRSLNIIELKVGSRDVSVRFALNQDGTGGAQDPERLINLIRTDSVRYRVTPDNRFVVKFDEIRPAEVFRIAESVIRLVEGRNESAPTDIEKKRVRKTKETRN